ncbi:DUF5615 family PIN-like protein [Legionella pneumophila serogroup 1]|nr:hypothetical protein [Legionella pneumophila]HCJ4404763.1 DUF5615 family PIN-like protein [Legionella pneumophila]HDV6761989.1 DUF5615 family PIN-like protein [Legionella pneumophila]
MWENVKSLTKDEEKKFTSLYKRKARFLVDENLGNSTCEVLKELGWNTLFVSEVDLIGKSDKDIYRYAFKNNRIILTHDTDFLNDKQFPFYCNPGVIVFPGGDGNDKVLERSIADMLIVVAPFGEIYKGAKIIFYADREFKIISEHKHGYIETSRYKFIDGNIYAFTQE